MHEVAYGIALQSLMAHVSRAAEEEGRQEKRQRQPASPASQSSPDSRDRDRERDVSTQHTTPSNEPAPPDTGRWMEQRPRSQKRLNFTSYGLTGEGLVDLQRLDCVALRAEASDSGTAQEAGAEAACKMSHHDGAHVHRGAKRSADECGGGNDVCTDERIKIHKALDFTHM